MHKVHQTPFIKITIPFIAGILLSRYIGFIPNTIVLPILVLFIIAGFGFQFLPLTLRRKLSWLQGCNINLVIILLGLACNQIHDIRNQSNWYRNQLSANTKVLATLTTPLSETPRTYKAQAHITRIYQNDSCKKTSGKAILYFAKNDSMPALKQGDAIIVANKFNPVLSRGNPGEFDYASFCNNRGIYDQAFLTKTEWQKTISPEGSIKNPFLIYHERIKEILSEHISDNNASGIAKALITGYRDDIQDETFTDYTKTGLVHLLAISGLHMGIFYVGTQFLLGLIPFFKRRKKLLIVLSLISMWLFAMLTTFPPSVQRASVMFTFLGIGQLLQRKTSSINFLAASAFFLLLLQPHLLVEVGFQLSYAAVLGILLFYRPLSKWWFPKNIILRKVWQIMCVSLAAQVFTFPLVVYYFHQFPMLFLLTNIVAIPLVTLIIYGELLLVLLSSIPVAAKALGWLVEKLILLLNDFIHFTAGLSIVSIQNISISRVQCLLLFIILGSISIWLLAKRKSAVLISLCGLLSFIGIGVLAQQQHIKQHKLVIYNTQSPYMEYINGKHYFTPDTISAAYHQAFTTYVQQPSHQSIGITSIMNNSPHWHQYPQYDLLKLNNTTVIRIRKAYKLVIKNKPKLDYLILSDSWIKKPEELVKQFDVRELIIDGNIPMWKIPILKSQLQGLDLPTHYIGSQGAKIILL